MIKFNWEKLIILNEFKPEFVIVYMSITRGVKIKYLPQGILPNKLRRKAKNRGLPIGDSFILNIDPLLNNSGSYTINEIFNYIELASRRSLFEYSVQKIKTLPLALALDSKYDATKNRLLTIDNAVINFKYE